MIEVNSISSPSHFEIIYADDDIIAINKPHGLLTIQDGYQKFLPNLLSLLKNEFPMIMTVHRLDKETSGLILFAKNPSAHRFLSMQFEKRSIKKEYRGIVLGVPNWHQKTIDLPLRVDGDRHHRTVIDFFRGKPAQTDVEVIENGSQMTLLQIHPHTGYTHQIRAHLAYIGNPIAGDELYLDQNKVNPSIKELQPAPRLMLHAYSIEFTHPSQNKLIKLVAPCSDDFHL